MDYILKGNLWKFFKSLRVQANQIYCMLVASPIHYAWITIVDKKDSSVQQRVTIAQFVKSLKEMPSVGKCYKLGINLYLNNTQSSYEAASLSELSVEIVEGLFVGIVSYHCKEWKDNGKLLELTPQVIQHYKFKQRYIQDLQTIVEQCNASITMNKTNHNYKLLKSKNYEKVFCNSNGSIGGYFPSKLRV